MINKRRTDDYGSRVRIVKALAHPARLLIIDELKDGPMCVCELRKIVGTDISTVSKHLSVLKNAGILSCEKKGLKVFYRLNCPCVADIFNCVEGVLRTTAGEYLRNAGGRVGRR